MKKGLFSLTAFGGFATLFWYFIVPTPIGFVLGTFTYSKGYSYLLNDPKACANCHVMQDHLYSYEKSSHKKVAVCNSCHTPDGLFNKYLSKAVNGWNHGLAFTTGKYPWPLKINQYNKDITNKSCLKCHDNQVNHFTPKKSKNCIQCHSNVGHMR